MQSESVNLPELLQCERIVLFPPHVSRHLHIQTLEIDLLPVCYFPILSVPLLFLIFCFYVLTGCDLAADLRRKEVLMSRIKRINVRYGQIVFDLDDIDRIMEEYWKIVRAVLEEGRCLRTVTGRNPFELI